MDGVIERKRRAGEGDDLVSRLLQSRDPETGASMNARQVRDEVLTMFIAGHETTANGLAWAMGLLAAHPEIQAKCHAELDELGRPAEVDDLRGLGYLTSVISETLRLYPPAWVTDRSAEEDVTIGDVEVPKGSVVYVCPYVTHRRPDVWAEPELFRPERFAKEKRKELPRFAYYPFGGGPRKCVGANFALIEMSLVLARLLRRFELEPTGPMPELDPRITLRPKNGLKVKMTRRDVA